MKVSGRAVTLLAGACFFTGYLWQHGRDEDVSTAVLEARIAHAESTLKDTELELAGTRLDKAKLANALEAAKLLKGKPVAGFVIKVPARDTVIVHDTVTTTLLPDSTRVGKTQDSTWAGAVSVTAVAPPCCAPLKIDLTIQRPAFTPEVSFIKVGEKYVAMVYWQGETVEVDAAFYKPPGPRRVLVWAEGTYNIDGPHEVRAGTAMRLLGFQVGPAVSQRLIYGERPALGVVLRREF